MADMFCESLWKQVFYVATTRVFNVPAYWFSLCEYTYLSYDVASRSEIKPCNKIDKPLLVNRFWEML